MKWIRVGAVLAGFLVVTTALAIEEPAYSVVQSYPEFEVREYPAFRVAEVTLAGDADSTGDEGFRILAGYIFGQNAAQEKITMTAPVLQMPESEAERPARYVVQFTMPAALKPDQVPTPDDSRIKLTAVPAGRMAVIRYSGRWTTTNYEEHLAALRAAVARAGLATEGEPLYARYNPPFMPWFMRRNEIWLRLKPEGTR